MLSLAETYRHWTGSLRALPTFLLVGAQRSGTTSLCDYLRRHPGVFLRTKEVHYFDNQFSKDLNWYRAHFPIQRWAQRKARTLGHPLAIGEASPYYLFHPEVPQRVLATLPDVRILCLLRHPTERALSQFRHEHRFGYETEPSFRNAWELEARRLAGAERVLSERGGVHAAHNHSSYTSRGDYAPQLERWIELFGRERIHVICSEDLFRETRTAMRGLYPFLGLPDIDLGVFPHSNSTAPADVDPELRSALDEHFRPRIEQLEQLLGRETGWLAE